MDEPVLPQSPWDLGLFTNAFLYFYSPTINKYYVGETKDLDQRLIEHRTRFLKGYTSQTNDWELKLSLLFENINQARRAEAFIKRMNSKSSSKNLSLIVIGFGKFIV
ncbi:MAG: GIY-YIG nuclease family protein [Bacteroidetes bacterium]|nr:GIY-YIG nuclease family protein [Bacteroidota bacterium]